MKEHEDAYVGNFNSIKVRLEPDSVNSITICMEFQFHKGAIRTPMKLFVITSWLQFQFHKGAIRTLSDEEFLTLYTISIP